MLCMFFRSHVKFTMLQYLFLFIFPPRFRFWRSSIYLIDLCVELQYTILAGHLPVMILCICPGVILPVP